MSPAFESGAPVWKDTYIYAILAGEEVPGGEE